MGGVIAVRPGAKMMQYDFWLSRFRKVQKFLKQIKTKHEVIPVVTVAHRELLHAAGQSCYGYSATQRSAGKMCVVL